MPQWPSLVRALTSQLNDTARQWLEKRCEAINTTYQTQGLTAASEQLLQFSATAHRQLNRERLCIPSSTSSKGVAWYSDEVARVRLLITLKVQVPVNDWPDTLFQIYRLYDENEKIACIRALSWLTHGGDLNTLALEATRANSIRLFSAIALNNDYPHQYFQSRAFYQIVLKALFSGLSIQHLVGLQERQSPELTKLCADLVQEHLLAHRAVPESIWLGMTFQYLSADAQDTYQQFLFSGSPSHQHYALSALKANGTAGCPSSLLARMQQLDEESSTVSRPD